MIIYIEDLMVLPAFRKKDIGTLLIQHIIDCVENHYPSSCEVGLFSSRNLHFFFKRFGFNKRESSEPGMLLNWKEYELAQKRYT